MKTPAKRCVPTYGDTRAAAPRRRSRGLLPACWAPSPSLRQSPQDTASQALRDDYTALSLASVSYGMLHATTLGLTQGTVAELARHHLEEINSLIMELGLPLLRVVLKELAFEGYSVETGVAERAVRNLEETWRNSAQREKAGVAGGAASAGVFTDGSFSHGGLGRFSRPSGRLDLTVNFGPTFDVVPRREERQGYLPLLVPLQERRAV